MERANFIINNYVSKLKENIRPEIKLEFYIYAPSITLKNTYYSMSDETNQIKVFQTKTNVQPSALTDKFCSVTDIEPLKLKL